MPTALAILDDYSSIAVKHFSHIPDLATTSIPDTISSTDPASLQAQIERLSPYAIIAGMRERTPLPRAVLAALPRLRLVLTTGMRNPSIDVAAAREAGIVVAGTTGRGVKPDDEGQNDDDDDVARRPAPPNFGSVNQHGWALLLALASRVGKDDRRLRVETGSWQSGMMVELGGRTLGVVGLGKLGGQMARTGVLGFGMKVIAWSENLTVEKAEATAKELGLREGTVEVVSKEELFRRADVVSLHTVLSDRTRGLVGERELGWMKKGALLVNTARAGLIDEKALVEVLKAGRIGGVAMDVFWEEPFSADNQWRKVDEWAKAEVVLSPHMGYVSPGTMERWYEEQAENVERWLNGKEVLNKMN